MESMSEEDKSEFFESAQEILSTACSESGEEDGGLSRLWKSNSSQIYSRTSGYEVWRNNPGTIMKRRQKLLMEMQLDSDLLPVSFSQSLRNLQASPDAMIAASSKLSSRDGPSNKDGNDSFSPPSLLPSESMPCKKPMKNIEVHGVCEPSHLSSGFYRQQNKKTAMQVGTVSLESSSSSIQGVSESTILSFPDLSGRIEVKYANETSIDKDAKFHSVTSELTESSYSLPGENQKVGQDKTLLSETTNTEMFRIKNLDNGKVFTVSDTRKDGLWNKLKELDTGRELTLEEFESSLGFLPILKEVIRREKAAEVNGNKESFRKRTRWLKTIKSVVRSSRERSNLDIQGSASDGRDDSSHNARLITGSATDEGQEAPSIIPKRVKVHSHGKSSKELTELHMRQEFQAHQGAIWTMKFSLDGNYLASAGQDCIVHVWEVLEQKFMTGISPDKSDHENTMSQNLSSENCQSGSQIIKKGGINVGFRDKKRNQALAAWPSNLFTLSQSPKYSLHGHTEDVLDLSWSRSQLLLSSSMDKTVRLWHIYQKECLRVFKHHDYVTCINFNPVDNGYFISGSLDGKVRIWNIANHQVVDWADLHEMVTAASYTPDAKGAIVGSYKGTCRFYDTLGNKLQLTAHVDVQQRKRRKSQGKKITGFQFVPGEISKVLITSSDSRIRVYDGTKIICKYKGFRNANSQISASFSPNGRYIISASEDSRVYVWTYSNFSSIHHGKKARSGSYEKFCSKNVLLAIPWPGMDAHPDLSKNIIDQSIQMQDSSHSSRDELSSSGHGFDGNTSALETSGHSLDYETEFELDSCHHKIQQMETFTLSNPDNKAVFPVDILKNVDIFPEASTEGLLECNGRSSPYLGTKRALGLSESYIQNDSEFMPLTSMPLQVGNHSFFFDGKVSATWPEEKLPPDAKVDTAINGRIKVKSSRFFADQIGCQRNMVKTSSAWGLVIVTAGLGGKIRTFQNYGFPLQP